MKHWILALLLLPSLWATLHQTGLMIPSLMAEGFRSWWRYAAGAVIYVLVERLLVKPMWLYVVGHELTHVFTGVLSGARVHSFEAKSNGGQVKLSKSNAVIALSPYIVPFYGLGLILVYVVTRHWWNPPQLRLVFQFLLGAALAFHISLTVSAIHKHQSDLKVLGFFLSGVLILMGNLLILAALGISLFSKTPTFSAYGTALMKDTVGAWKFSIDAGTRAAMWLYRVIEAQHWTR